MNYKQPIMPLPNTQTRFPEHFPVHIPCYLYLSSLESGVVNDSVRIYIITDNFQLSKVNR
jgi:hypothetical protein